MNFTRWAPARWTGFSNPFVHSSSASAIPEHDSVRTSPSFLCARAVLGKAAKDVVDAISEMEKDFPFPIKSIRSDCGTEFINETMIDRFKNRLEE